MHASRSSVARTKQWPSVDTRSYVYIQMIRVWLSNIYLRCHEHGIHHEKADFTSHNWVHYSMSQHSIKKLLKNITIIKASGKVTCKKADE